MQWFHITTRVTYRQLDLFVGERSEVFSFNLLVSGPGYPIFAALQKLYDCPQISAWQLVDSRHMGTAAEYQRIFGRDGQYDKAIAVR